MPEFVSSRVISSSLENLTLVLLEKESGVLHKLQHNKTRIVTTFIFKGGKYQMYEQNENVHAYMNTSFWGVNKFYMGSTYILMYVFNIFISS